MNKLFVTGRLVKDPEMRDLKVGNETVKHCRFRIAIARRNTENETDFFNVVVWRKQAENCGKYLKKGSQVSVVGRIENSMFKGKDGKDVQATEIIAEEVEFLNRVTTDEQPVNNSTKKINTEKTETPIQNSMDLAPIDDEDMPF